MWSSLRHLFFVSHLLLTILLVALLVQQFPRWPLSQLAQVGAPDLPDFSGYRGGDIMLGDYAGEPRLPTERVDNDLLVSRLQELNANTYAFLLWHRPETDFEDLKLFLEKSRGLNLAVYAYLVPPDEQCQAVKPYGCDFEAWGRELATLSRTYPHLVGWIIDDFYFWDFFTPDYVSRFVRAAKNVNPDFRFYPIVYYSQFIQSNIFYNYSSTVDGIILPFHSTTPSCNLTSTSELDGEIKYFNETYRAGLQGLTVKYPASSGSQIDEAGGFKTNLTLNDAGDLAFEFKILNPLWTTTAGYHFAQLLLDGAVIWEKDLMEITRPTATTPFSVVTLPESALGRTVELRWQVIEKRPVSNYPVEVQLITPVGGWTPFATGAFTTEQKQLTSRTPALIIMVYSGGYCGGQIPAPDYVERVTRLALEAADDGKVKGIMQYVLNKTDRAVGSQFDLVRKLYAKYLPEPPEPKPPPPPPPPPVCLENWSCVDYSACSATLPGTTGTRIRTCVDTNKCGTTADRPRLSRTCQVGEPDPLPDTEPLLAPPPPPIAPSAKYPPLTALFAKHTSGPHVSQLQKMLAEDNSVFRGGDPDGYYGQKTIDGVKRFQLKYGIPTDAQTFGLSGPATRAKLNALYATPGGAPLHSPADQAMLIALQKQLLVLLQQLATLLTSANQ